MKVGREGQQHLQAPKLQVDVIKETRLVLLVK